MVSGKTPGDLRHLGSGFPMADPYGSTGMLANRETTRQERKAMFSSPLFLTPARPLIKLPALVHGSFNPRGAAVGIALARPSPPF